MTRERAQMDHENRDASLFGGARLLPKDHKLTNVRYHAYTIWLFTFSDLKTIVIPKTLFATLGAFSGSVSILSSAPPSAPQILSRIPLVFLWVWMNLLPFAINNQRLPLGIQEDSINKPWRPLPSQRCTPAEARYMMFIGYALALLLSSFTGSVKQCVGLILLGYWYNNLGGADNGFLIRNFINGCGYICFASGAMNTMLTYSDTAALSAKAWEWLVVLGSVVVSTVQLQDLYDQDGDSLRGRRTMPLVLGDNTTRWILAPMVGFWSFWCPLHWDLSGRWHLPTTVIGAIIGYRILFKRSVQEDKTTFLLWNAWIVVLYALPLMKSLSHS